MELSFLVSVHQDGEAEGGEYFDLSLHQPWGGARLGAQQRTRVTIIDAESNGSRTDHALTTWFDEEGDVGEGGEEYIYVVAGAINNATIVARDALGNERGFGGDVFAAWVEGRGEDSDEDGGTTVRASCNRKDTYVQLFERAQYKN